MGIYVENTVYSVYYEAGQHKCGWQISQQSPASHQEYPLGDPTDPSVHAEYKNIGQAALTSQAAMVAAMPSGAVTWYNSLSSTQQTNVYNATRLTAQLGCTK